MTSMLKGGKSYDLGFLTYGGCSCHNSKRDHRKMKKAAKLREKKQWMKESSE